MKNIAIENVVQPHNHLSGLVVMETRFAYRSFVSPKNVLGGELTNL